MDVFAEIGAKDSHFQAKMMEVSEVGRSSRVAAGLADSTIRDGENPCRKWFKHLVMTLVLLNGDDFIHEFGPDGQLTILGWTTFSCMLISKDARMYGKWKIRWSHLFDIQFVEHLMYNSDDLNYELLARMMGEDVLGYKLHCYSGQ
ncbi:hypothetical protein ACQJBY_053611 [Aegilops geniculata]